MVYSCFKLHVKLSFGAMLENRLVFGEHFIKQIANQLRLVHLFTIFSSYCLSIDLLLQRTGGFEQVLFKERLNCINKEHNLKSCRSFCGRATLF